MGAACSSEPANIDKRRSQMGDQRLSPMGDRPRTTNGDIPVQWEQPMVVSNVDYQDGGLRTTTTNTPLTSYQNLQPEPVIPAKVGYENSGANNIVYQMPGMANDDCTNLIKPVNVNLEGLGSINLAHLPTPVVVNASQQSSNFQNSLQSSNFQNMDYQRTPVGIPGTTNLVNSVDRREYGASNVVEPIYRQEPVSAAKSYRSSGYQNIGHERTAVSGSNLVNPVYQLKPGATALGAPVFQHVVSKAYHDATNVVTPVNQSETLAAYNSVSHDIGPHTKSERGNSRVIRMDHNLAAYRSQDSCLQEIGYHVDGDGDRVMAMAVAPSINIKPVGTEAYDPVIGQMVCVLDDHATSETYSQSESVKRSLRCCK